MAKRRDCPWLILDLVAIQQGDKLSVWCKVLNPEPGELQVYVSTDTQDMSQEMSIPINCPIAAPETCTFTGVKGNALVVASLFDSDGNLEYQTPPVPAGEARSKVKSAAPAPAKHQK